MFGLTTADGFPRGSLLGPSVLFGDWEYRPCVNLHQEISASVELCDTDVCFLHVQLIGTNV